MTSLPPVVVEAEALVRRMADDVMRPHPGECLCCYVARQLDQFPCDGTHRHSLAYRDAFAPRATALRERLSRVGGCCCDCEIFLNGYTPLRGFDQLPECAGVRRGSVRPCSNWRRR